MDRKIARKQTRVLGNQQQRAGRLLRCHTSVIKLKYKHTCMAYFWLQQSIGDVRIYRNWVIRWQTRRRRGLEHSRCRTSQNAAVGHLPMISSLTTSTCCGRAFLN